MGQRELSEFTANVLRAMEAKGLRTRDLVMLLPQRNWMTWYRVASGSTTDPKVSTVLALCGALDVDPDALLGTSPTPLPPDLQELLDAARGMSEDDQWLVVDVLRAVMRRRRGQRHGQR